MKNLIIIFSIFFLLLACKREKMWFNDTTVEGIVLDSVTFEPYKEIKIQLFRYYRKGWFMPTYESKVIKTIKTDDNGFFRFKFNSVKEKAYYINVDLGYSKDVPYKDSRYEAYINNLYYYRYEIDVDSIIKYKYIYIVKL